MALFTDGGSRYLAIGRNPHKLGVYILDDGNPRPLRMTFAEAVSVSCMATHVFSSFGPMMKSYWR